jgi:hypothetical protein
MGLKELAIVLIIITSMKKGKGPASSAVYAV